MTNIKTVAQALRRIKELKGKIAQTTVRMQQSVCWTEPGQKLIYDYDELGKERDYLVTELVDLKARLLKTNSLTEIEVEGFMTKTTVQKLIFSLAELKATREFLRGLPIKEGDAKANSGEFDSYGHPIYIPVKLCAAIGLRQRDDLITKLDSQIAAVHEAIEGANHRTLLVE